VLTNNNSIFSSSKSSWSMYFSLNCVLIDFTISNLSLIYFFFRCLKPRFFRLKSVWLHSKILLKSVIFNVILFHWFTNFPNNFLKKNPIHVHFCLWLRYKSLEEIWCDLEELTRIFFSRVRFRSCYTLSYFIAKNKYILYTNNL
jgi:hypothetical protein